MRTSIQPRLGHPFVKWAGGKTQLLPEISSRLPHDFSRRFHTYVEPFVGGGAVALWLLRRHPGVRRAVLSDVNPRLVNAYVAVKECPTQLIAALGALEDRYLPLDHDARTDLYMEQRQLFNDGGTDGVEQAARLIFLNRTCFNGLYRENAKGAFNVPHGRYRHPAICDAPNLMAVSELLQRVELRCGDFGDTIDCAGPATFYYLDPPYKPLSATSSFNSYVGQAFGDEEQLRLRDFCDTLAASGSQFVLSNSDVRDDGPLGGFFHRLYSRYHIDRVAATRMVNANASGRGPITELMITNVDVS